MVEGEGVEAMLEWFEKLSRGKYMRAVSICMPFKNPEYGVDKRIEW